MPIAGTTKRTRRTTRSPASAQWRCSHGLRIAQYQLEHIQSDCALPCRPSAALSCSPRALGTAQALPFCATAPRGPRSFRRERLQPSSRSHHRQSSPVCPSPPRRLRRRFYPPVRGLNARKNEPSGRPGVGAEYRARDEGGQAELMSSEGWTDTARHRSRRGGKSDGNARQGWAWDGCQCPG